MMNRRWHGQLRVDGETAWWSGSLGEAAAHRHFAAQAVFSNHLLRVVGEDGHEVSGSCLLIEPNARHLLLPANEAEICYVEPTTVFGPPEVLRDRISAYDPRIISGGGSLPFWRDWTERRARASIDARISCAVDEIERLLPVGTLRLADVCGAARLSVGRFRHLFSAEIGVPFQRFVLWRRLAAAFADIRWFEAMGDALDHIGPLQQCDKIVSSLVLHQCPMDVKEAIVRQMWWLLKPGGELYIADYGEQRSLLMRTLFRQVQMIDGFELTEPNARGCVPPLLRDAGFREVEEVRVIPTPTGSISLYQARR